MTRTRVIGLGLGAALVAVIAASPPVQSDLEVQTQVVAVEKARVAAPLPPELAPAIVIANLTYQNVESILIAGPPGIAKTIFALSAANYTANETIAMIASMRPYRIPEVMRAVGAPRAETYDPRPRLGLTRL